MLEALLKSSVYICVLRNGSVRETNLTWPWTPLEYFIFMYVIFLAKTACCLFFTSKILLWHCTWTPNVLPHVK